MGRFFKTNSNLTWIIPIGVAIFLAVWGFTREDTRAASNVESRVVALETRQSEHRDFAAYNLKIITERLDHLEVKVDIAADFSADNNRLIRELMNVPQPFRPRRPPPR